MLPKFFIELNGSRGHMSYNVLIWQSLVSLTTYQCFDFSTGNFFGMAKNALDGIDDLTAVV